MPRRQSQKQKQSVRQTVIVKLGETKKRKRTYRRKSKRGVEPQYIQGPSLPPNVIYQSSQLIPYAFQQEPLPKITEPQGKKPALEDTGIVGTEGVGVRILELPTKKETLSELTSPVPPSAPVLSREEIARKREQKMMGGEDIASIQLGLSQFNTAPPPQIAEGIETPMPQPVGKEPGPEPIGPGVMERQSAAMEKIQAAPKAPANILSKMYEKYGPKLEEEAAIREEKRQRRNRLAREKYARKKMEQKPKEE